MSRRDNIADSHWKNPRRNRSDGDKEKYHNRLTERHRKATMHMKRLQHQRVLKNRITATTFRQVLNKWMSSREHTYTHDIRQNLHQQKNREGLKILETRLLIWLGTVTGIKWETWKKYLWKDCSCLISLFYSSLVALCHVCFDHPPPLYVLFCRQCYVSP